MTSTVGTDSKTETPLTMGEPTEPGRAVVVARESRDVVPYDRSNQPAGLIARYENARRKAEMKSVLTIAEMKTLARRRVPKMFFDYADSGAWTEGTYRANEDDFSRIKLRQRVLVDMTGRSLASEMVGETVSMPVALSPTGLTGMQHADGEMLAAQAAEEFGVPFTLSTMSICSIEDVKSVTKKPFWFQLYVM